ncbi:hypothetical protein FOL47_011338 [Perkinsus chesapeaki]|uniref:N-acetyltransferase domain-containing protein n=1 Tax=Perkinsus chesapeaki TaxID=330153 RepID=A0A7J6KXH0_PERCH|nr:hypothetical protein FOL47_011338 [Perkinsus chesapeaki]
MPDSYFILIANLVFSTTAEITYRDYKKGDKYYDTTLRRLCQRKAGIPCWVSVYSAKSEDTVVGFVSMDMPYKLTEGEEKAVRKKMCEYVLQGCAVPGSDLSWLKTLSCIYFEETLVAVQGRTIVCGDKSTNYKFDQNCKDKAGIPCYVAVDLSKGSNVVVGFIEINIPYEPQEEVEEAVRRKMPHPKKKGIFGNIEYVEVDSEYQRRGIGANLIKNRIGLGKKTHNVLALILYAFDDNKAAMRLYRSLGFVDVLDYPGLMTYFAFYY